MHACLFMSDFKNDKYITKCLYNNIYFLCKTKRHGQEQSKRIF